MKRVVQCPCAAPAQGLIRQVVLVPGLDATDQVCPSPDSHLAALSVPPLLLDLPIKRRQGGTHQTSYGNSQFTRH